MFPTLFVAHGSPMLAVETNEYTTFLSQVARNFPKPQAIVLFTAHWEDRIQQIGAASQYGMIYDFYGFPKQLYDIVYPAQGDTALAARIERLLNQHDLPCSVDAERGLDHGSWVVLRLLYPEADIPVVQMSVNSELAPDKQYEIGRALSGLREEGVLIIGSGGTVHNLAKLNWTGPTESWAVQFEDWLSDTVQAWNLERLFRYEQLAPFARDAVPPRGREHFAPLLYAMGAADAGRTADLLHRSFQYGTLSHTVWRFS